MLEPEFTVTPFGDRWVVAQGSRRLSIHPSFDVAMAAAADLAQQATAVGDRAMILVRERDGTWRECAYQHRPQYIGRRGAGSGRSASG